MEAVKLGLILKKLTLISVLLKGWFLLCLPKRCAQSFLTYIEIMPSPIFMTGVDKRKKKGSGIVAMQEAFVFVAL